MTFTIEKHKPEISVITGCYNTGARFLESLDSIRNQVFNNYELIIYDDGSKDDSVTLIDKWIEHYQKHFRYPIKFIKNDINLGIAKSLNNAVKLSKGKYFTILGDDVWNKDFLNKTYAIIENSDEKVALVFCDTYVMDYNSKIMLEDINPLKNINRWFPQKEQLVTQLSPDLYRFNHVFLYECFYHFSPVIAFTTLIKTEIVRELGYYDEAYYFEDLAMWLKIFYRYDCLFLNQKLATYNKHQKSISSSPSFAYQATMVNVFLAELVLKKVNKKNMNGRICSEYWKLFTVWKQDSKSHLVDILKITAKVSRYYPKIGFSFLKHLLLQKWIVR